MPTPPVVLVHEFEVTYGFIDLVGVSPTGAVTVVECKLQGNPDMKRTIVGQLFAYAAGLWGMSYADFDEAWQAKTQPFNMSAETWERRKRGPLVDEMAAAVAEHGLTWDRDTFPAAVEANLAAGRYTLVFAVDDITPELRRIVEYLSEHTAPEVSVIALEIRYLRDGDTEVLVPQPYGQEMAQRKATVTSTRPHVAGSSPRPRNGLDSRRRPTSASRSKGRAWSELSSRRWRSAQGCPHCCPKTCPWSGLWRARQESN